MRTRTYTTLIEKHIVAFRAASMRVSNIDDPIAFPDPCKETEHSSGSRTERPEEAGSDGADACDAIDNDRIARENRLRVHLGGSFVDIHPHQEQVRAALEAKAAGTLATTAMLYSHRDIYELLVFRSYGTPYEHFLDWLVDEEDRTTLRVLELIHGAEKARAVISKESLHIVNHAFYSALSENIIHAKSVEELNATTEVISTFFNAGWEKYRML